MQAKLTGSLRSCSWHYRNSDPRPTFAV
uniref:Uncharacterized protein n=1 Tax=Rhizophora mucronata TaxID=61149 RepID=A0A2P2Q9V9_RHIMU